MRYPVDPLTRPERSEVLPDFHPVEARISGSIIPAVDATGQVAEPPESGSSLSSRALRIQASRPGSAARPPRAAGPLCSAAPDCPVIHCAIRGDANQAAAQAETGRAAGTGPVIRQNPARFAGIGRRPRHGRRRDRKRRRQAELRTPAPRGNVKTFVSAGEGADAMVAVS
jgi:hypothetical protein